MAGLLWWLGYIFLYAWRLPVTYQHGRYIMPAMPIYFLWGAIGMLFLIFWATRSDTRMIIRSLGKVWVASTVIVLLLFWGLGAQSYGRDVGVIETEMVATANWILENTLEDDIIAAHDIGAIGYFTQREIVDLAGLVSPDVIPFIRDEDRLIAFMDESQVDYLVTFPAWYPSLIEEQEIRFKTSGIISPEIGGENMLVYRWPGGN